MPIAAMLVGGGTMLLFFCQYHILGSMWKNYYWSRHHFANLSKLNGEIEDMKLEHKRRWLAAHPGASADEIAPLIKKDKEEDTEQTKVPSC